MDKLAISIIIILSIAVLVMGFGLQGSGEKVEDIVREDLGPEAKELYYNATVEKGATGLRRFTTGLLGGIFNAITGGSSAETPPAPTPIMREGVGGFSEESENFKVDWTEDRKGVSYFCYRVDIQNLKEEKQDFNLSALFSDTDFLDIEKITDVSLYEWKGLDTEFPTYDNHIVWYSEPPQNGTYPSNCWNDTGNETHYPCNETYQNGTEELSLCQWKESKMYMFKEGDKLKGHEGAINIPKYGSEPKYDDFGTTETEDGTKYFKFCFRTPITEYESGWGSGGKVGFLEENRGEFFHPWFNSSYNYRMNFTIVNTGGDLTDYTVFLELDNSTTGAGFNWSNKGIAFTNSTDYELDYFIDSWNVTAKTALIAVEFPSILNNTGETGYMYYHAGSDNSNGNDTFLAFDQFPSAFSGWSGQTVYYKHNSTLGYNDSGSVQKNGTTGEANSYIYLAEAESNIEVRARAWQNATGCGDCAPRSGVFIGTDGDADHYYSAYLMSSPAVPCMTIYEYDNGAYAGEIAGLNVYGVYSGYQWVNIILNKYENTLTGYWTFDNNSRANTTNASGAAAFTVGYVGIHTYDQNVVTDRFMVRKYTSPDPVFSMGSEETKAGVDITIISEYPADPATYTTNANYTFNATVCHTTNNTAIALVNLTWAGTTTIITDNTTINTTCLNFYESKTDLAAGTYNYLWYAEDNASDTATKSSSYTVNKNSSNAVSISVSPSNSVDFGVQTTTTCVATFGTPVLELDSVGVANPHTTTLAVGSYTYFCEVEHDNYTTKNDTEIVTIGMGGTGCSNNVTYAYLSTIEVANSTTVLNFSSYITDGNIRADLKDHYVEHNDTWVNGTLLLINTTGSIGDIIEVYFGNYLNANSISNTAAQTVTNSITNVTEANNFVLLTFMDEMTLTETRAPNTNTTLTFYCTGGSQSVTVLNSSSDTKVLAATYGTWEEVIAKVAYAPDDYYIRHLLFDSPTEYRNLWIVDAETYQVVEVVNDLDDLTGDFLNARLTIKKWVGGGLRIIDDQYFDASGMAYFYGVNGDRYQYHISNDVETRALGDVWVDSNQLTKTITISGISIGDIEYMSELEFAFSFDNATGIIEMYYYDPYNRTTTTNFSVYYVNGTTPIYFSSATTNNTVLFSYLVPDNNESYKVNFQVQHEPTLGAISLWFYSGIAGVVVLALAGISAFWKSMISLGAILSINMTASQKSAAMGVVVSGILLVMFVSIGWLVMSMGIVAVILCLGMFLLFRREASKP